MSSLHILKIIFHVCICIIHFQTKNFKEYNTYILWTELMQKYSQNIICVSSRVLNFLVFRGPFCNFVYMYSIQCRRALMLLSIFQRASGALTLLSKRERLKGLKTSWYSTQIRKFKHQRFLLKVIMYLTAPDQSNEPRFAVHCKACFKIPYRFPTYVKT